MIVTSNSLSKIRKRFKGKTIVFAGGTFDVFHTGHIRALKNLRKYGDIVVIGITSDKRVVQKKGPQRPILNQNERAELVDAVRYVDYVTIMPPPSTQPGKPTLKTLALLKPDIFITVENAWIPFLGQLKEMNMKVKILKRIHSSSSTLVIDRILKKYK